MYIMYHALLFTVLCWITSPTVAKIPRFGSETSNIEDKLNTKNPLREASDLWSSLPGLLEPKDLLQPRSFANSAQLLTYTPKLSVDEASTRFNISVAISGCKHGVRWSTVAGPYTFANGTNKRDTAVGEIIDNLKTFRMNTLDHLDADQAMANHTLTLAQNVATVSNDMLQNQLICKDLVQHSGSEILHDELRKLLWDQQKIKKEIRELGVLIFASAVAGLLGGLVTGLGAAYNLAPDPPPDFDLLPGIWLPSVLETLNISSEADVLTALAQVPGQRPEDVGKITFYNYFRERYGQAFTRGRQLQLRNTGIITGITVFIATLSAGIVTDIMSRRRLRGEQAAAANIFLAQANGALQDIAPFVAAQPAVPVEPADGTPLVTPAVPTFTSVSLSPSASPSSSPGPVIGADCLNAPEAAAFTGSLGALEMTALGSPPPVDLDVQPFNQVQQEMLNEVLIDGVCQVQGGL